MPNEKPAIDEQSLLKLNDLLKTVDLSEVTADGTGRTQVQDGYYLCQLDKAQLTVSKKGNPQIALTFTIVETGFEEDEFGENLVQMKKSFKNQKIFKYYPLTDSQNVQRFVTDMLKFEDEPGHSILPKEAFTSSELIEESIQMLETMRLFINVSNTKNEEGAIINTWYNLISWKRANALGLPVE